MKEFKTRIVPRFVLQVSEKAWRQCLAELEIVNWTELTFVYPKHQLLLKQMKPNFPLQFKFFFHAHFFCAKSNESPLLCFGVGWLFYTGIFINWSALWAPHVLI